MPSYSLGDLEVTMKSTDGEEVQVVQRTNGTVTKTSNGDTTDHHDGKMVGEEGEGEDAKEQFGLKRTLGVFGAISFNLGTMIGSGIFVSPKGVLENAGSVNLSLVMWTFTGIIAMLGGLCFAELGTLIGKSAGEFVYLQQAYGGALAFMFQFVTIFVIKPSSMAITSMTCAEYTLALMFDDGCGGAPAHIVKLTAIAIVWIIVFINISSVDASKSVQVIFTIAKVLALLIIILGGFVKLGQGYTQNFTFENSNWTFTSIILSFFSAYYAYNGWQMVNAIAEEVKNPKRNIPISVLVAVLAAMFLYVMTNVSYFTVLSPEELLASDTVAISWAQYVMPNFVWIMPIAVAMSTFGGVNGNTFVLGRYIYRSSREGHLPSIFSFVHVFRMTPVPALVLEAVVATIYILPADIQKLLDMLGFIMWTINGLVFVALIIFRKTKPDSDPRYKRAFKCPLIIAILMAILSVFFVITPIVLDPQFYYFFGLIIFIGCLVFYFPFVYFNKSIPGMDGFTRTCQLFTQSAPSQINVE